MAMEWLWGVDVPLWQLFARGSLVYWLLFLLFRFAVRREAGGFGIADLLVVVLIADAAQNAMSGGYDSVAEGAVLICTLVGWNLLFDWLSFRSPGFARFASPGALALVRDGRLVHRNLRREFITVEELMAKLRAHGVADLAEVRRATMEADGELSVVKRKDRKD